MVRFSPPIARLMALAMNVRLHHDGVPPTSLEKTARGQMPLLSSMPPVGPAAVATGYRHSERNYRHSERMGHMAAADIEEPPPVQRERAMEMPGEPVAYPLPDEHDMRVGGTYRVQYDGGSNPGTARMITLLSREDHHLLVREEGPQGGVRRYLPDKISTVEIVQLWHEHEQMQVGGKYRVQYFGGSTPGRVRTVTLLSREPQHLLVRAEGPQEVRRLSPDKVGTVEVVPPGVATSQDKHLPPGEALQRLMEGNERFVSGTAEVLKNFDDEKRKAPEIDPVPMASIISSSDIHAPIELLFDAKPGELFVLRDAKNADPLVHKLVTEAASGVKLLVVLGRTKQVQSAIEGTEATDAMTNAEAKVFGAVHKLLANIPLIREWATGGEVEVHGAVYDIATGRVKFLGQHPRLQTILHSFE